MKKKWLKRIFTVLLSTLVFTAAAVIPPFVEEAQGYVNNYTTVKIGLYYGDNALKAANLENYIGSGYSFGYFDSSRQFHEVGDTDTIKITMLKDWSMYLVGSTYYDEKPSTSYTTIGCYHIRLNTEYGSFDSAKAAAADYDDSFVAYHNGIWYVSVGSYTSKADAETALVSLGYDGTAMTASSGCVTVVETGTANILFQFDYETTYSLAVMPKKDSSGDKTQTWFKGYKYYGAFQYTRLSGGNMTVVNILNIEDYVKGVVPCEMSASWPLESLKAQAVCARTYAAAHINGHKSYGFDLCNTTDCQAYGGTNSSNSNSDAAVDETEGMYITYDGSLCEIFYSSSDGGATEDSENVFNTALPYLRGVKDDYEQYVETGKSSWTFTYTKAQITSILQMKGYSCADIVSVTPTYTKMGNIYSLKFTDSNGKNWTFSKYNASSILYSNTYGKYTYSMRFTVTASGSSTSSGDSSLRVNSSSGTLSDTDNIYAIGSGGTAEKITSSDSVTVISGDGTETVPITSGETTETADSYVVSGSGWGHNVGMSQYGAKAMAKLGYSYTDILKFYFTGVAIG